MRLRIQYLRVELKKTIGMFPRMLLQAILLMILISAIAFCGVKVMEKEPLAVGARIGVVVREDNTITGMALSYVENMESVSQICDFVQVSEEEGFHLLERREIAALVLLPEQLVEGIMNGQNPAVDVIFPKNAQLEAMLFRELTESGAGLLRVAQAQIYGAIDTAVEYGLTDQLSVMEADIDSYNLAFALDRLAMYDKETVSATGQMSVLQYYVASGGILFVLLSGITVYPVMQQEPLSFHRQLKRQGTGTMWQLFCKWMCGFVCIALFCGVALITIKLAGEIRPDVGAIIQSVLVSRRYRYSTGSYIGIILLVLITVTALIRMIYSLSGSRTGGILLILLVTVMMIYLSGGFIPSVFLPKIMQSLGDRLPTSYMIHAVGGLFAGYRDGMLMRCVTGLCIYTILFWIVDYYIGWKKGQ